MPQPDTVVAVDFGDRQHGPGASAEQRSDAPGISSIGHTAASLYRLLLTDLKLSAGGLGYALFYAALSILALAFAGAALVIKPAFAYSPLPALAGLASGLFAGAAYTVLRSLKGRAEPNLIIFTFSLVSTVATLPFVILAAPQPTAIQWWALVGTGVFAAGGQYGLTFAYHHARVGKVSVFTYLHVLFALVVGFAAFGERPDLLSLLGGAMIVAAAVLAHRVGTRREAA